MKTEDGGWTHNGHEYRIDSDGDLVIRHNGSWEEITKTNSYVAIKDDGPHLMVQPLNLFRHEVKKPFSYRLTVEETAWLIKTVGLHASVLYKGDFGIMEAVCLVLDDY